MTTTRGNGGYIIDAIVKQDNSPSYLLTRQYIYYTRKEAIQAFKQYLKDNNLKEV